MYSGQMHYILYLLGLHIHARVHLHSWLVEYKIGNITEMVEHRAKVTINGLYKVVQGLLIAAEIYDLEQTLSEIQGH